jgi:hypothetical protein
MYPVAPVTRISLLFDIDFIIMPVFIETPSSPIPENRWD